MSKTIRYALDLNALPPLTGKTRAYPLLLRLPNRRGDPAGRPYSQPLKGIGVGKNSSLALFIHVKFYKLFLGKFEPGPFYLPNFTENSSLAPFIGYYQERSREALVQPNFVQPDLFRSADPDEPPF